MIKAVSALFPLILLSSCLFNTEQEITRMKQGLSQKVFIIDTILTKKEIVESYNSDTLKLKLDGNGQYYFINGSPSLKPFEGTWDLSHDFEISYYVFKLNNGEIQKCGPLSIRINTDVLFFKDQNMTKQGLSAND